MAYWLQAIQTLPQPLSTWLTKSYLSEPVNGFSILFVHDYSHELISKNIYYLSQIYPLSLTVYSDIISLSILPFPYYHEYVKNNVLTFSHHEG